MEIELEKARSLLLVQQYELNRLQNSVNYYKNELKISKKHRMKIKNDSLHIKIKNVVFILSTDSVQFIGKSHHIVYGAWINLTKNNLKFISNDGTSEFNYKRCSIGRSLSLHIFNHVTWQTSYIPSLEEEDIYKNIIDQFARLIIDHKRHMY